VVKVYKLFNKAGANSNDLLKGCEKRRVLIKGGTIVSSQELVTGDVGMANGQIVYVGQDSGGTWDQVIDAKGKYILPGLIDPHVHLAEVGGGGAATAHDFNSGTLAAAQGGITTIIDFITPEAGGSLLEAMDKRLAMAEKNCHVDYSFHCVLREVMPRVINEIPEIVQAGINSFKVFTVYDEALPPEEIFVLLKVVNNLGGILLVHAEDRDTIEQLIGQVLAKGLTSPSMHEATRPLAAEEKSVGEVIEMAKVLNAKVYFVHLSAGRTVEMAYQAKLAGAKIFLETCPHYLAFNKNKLAEADGALYIMSPPLREENERQHLWEMLKKGAIDAIGTDQCLFTKKQKLSPESFVQVPNGVGGLQYLLPYLYTFGVKEGSVSWQQVVRMTSTRPAEIFSLPKKGQLVVGADADVVVFDPEGKTPVNDSIYFGQEDHSIYAGLELAGKVEYVFSRGIPVVSAGKVKGAPDHGKLIRRKTE
jgi:dihydropyrimidinase